MFFFLLSPIIMYNWILVLAAVIPAVILLVKVNKADKLEKESPALIRSLVFQGIFSTFFALVAERVLGALLNASVPAESVWYNIILYFGIVAFSEEVSKYVLLKKKTWNNREFNCQFDGVVYAVSVSLGFALWENISYVTLYGFGTALLRAVTAIPGHACFGVFMGIFYGQAKRFDYLKETGKSKACRILAVFAAAFLHGSYDYIASMESANATWYFVAFAAVLFVVSYIMVDRASKHDRFIDRHYSTYEIL